MKKLILILLILGIAVGSAFSDSLTNNEYYKKSVEFRALADKEFENGNYDLSYDYSKKAQEYAMLSQQYIEKMKLRYKANSRIKYAGYRMDYAVYIDLLKSNPQLFNEANKNYKEAQTAFDGEDYNLAIDKADLVIALLVDIQRAPTVEVPVNDPNANNTMVKPAFYTVRLIPERRDCLWRIAEYDFVYGDPYKWPTLWEANKDKLKDPNNPHLIFPGQVFIIPSVDGEVREGMYDPNKAYN